MPGGNIAGREVEDEATTAAAGDLDLPGLDREDDGDGSAAADRVLEELLEHGMAEMRFESGHRVAGVLVLEPDRFPLSVGGLRAGAEARDQPGGALLGGNFGHGPGAFEGDRLRLGIEADDPESGAGLVAELRLDRGDVCVVVRIEPGHPVAGPLHLRCARGHRFSVPAPARLSSVKLSRTSTSTGS
ncbi:MAG: hypothetical protein ACTINN_14190 [Brachybacterium tyrofermentans]